MTEIVDAINGAFQALFYGDGAWFGILLLLSMCIGLALKWKYTGVLTIPIMIFIGLDYVNRDMAWQATIMFFGAVFVVLYLIKEIK